ncbi:MAG: hypothetical protein JSU01_04000 [Bacteroidetes bacterium]|nr:hypothetical protein [Bacteroidota bacterium]
MIAIDAVKRTSILVKRFGVYVFIPLFLLVAYGYTSSIHKQYRLTAKIQLKDVSVPQALTDLHSEYLVKQTLDNLPFGASFYASESPETELYGTEVPIRLEFESPRGMDASEALLRLDVLQGKYAVLDRDTVAYYDYDQVVHEPYGDFKVLRRTSKNFKSGAFLVRFEDPSKQLDEYYNNLKVAAADDDKTVALSITTGNAKKSAAFLYKLLKQYGGTAVDRHGDMINSKFMLTEKPEDNIEMASVSPIWFYFIALAGGMGIPFGRSYLRKKRRGRLSRRLIAIPKLVDHAIQNGFVFKHAD